MKKNNKFIKVDKNKITGLKNWSQNKLVPFMGKIGNQRHLTAIRDAFGTMIPLIIAGSIGLLAAAIIFGGSGSGKVSILGLICKIATNWNWDKVQIFGGTTTGWSKASNIGSLMFSEMQNVTVGMMALYFSFLFGYFLGVNRQAKHPIMVGFASFGGFLVANMGQITFCMGAQGLISAILFGIISSELFMWFTNIKKLEIKLPDGVPPAVGKSFAVFLPMSFTLGIIAIANVIVLAPAIAATGWTVNSGGHSNLSSGNKNLIQIIISKNWLQNTIFYQYKNVINNFIPYFNNAVNHTSSATSLINYFNSLSSTDKSIISNFLVWNQDHVAINTLASITSDATTHFVTNNNHQLLSAAISYQQIVVGSNYFGLGEAIFRFFTSWFISFATSGGGLGLALLYSFFICFFWFFGVHGSNVMAAVFEPIWWMILGINASIFSANGWNGLSQMGTFGKPFFDSYMNIGGSGATLLLLILVFMFSRRKELREISKYSIGPGIFQINEPVIFGFPIVLNSRYIIPFTIAPLINIIIGWVFVDKSMLGIVHPPVIASPWTAPWFVGALLSTLDPKSLIPAFICFIIDFLIYLPFIFLDNKLYFKKLKKENPSQYAMEIRYWTDPIYHLEIKYQEKKDKISELLQMQNFTLEELKNNEIKDKNNKKQFSKTTNKINKLIKNEKILEKKYNISKNKILNNQNKK